MKKMRLRSLAGIVITLAALLVAIPGLAAVDDAYTKALLHMDGTDASTTFTDESGKTWTRSGDAQIDTDQYKFETASGKFDGSGDYVYTGDSADWDAGSGDYTVDYWARAMR
jgi:hypothetical protein